MSLPRFITYSYLFVVICLFFYSFTQVDLGLTLTQASIWQIAQKSFQQIGYFNRPVSSGIYLLLISAMFLYYAYFLISVFRKKINTKDLWIVIGLTSVILGLSYNAFSYDLFNYIFDAKIITHYHQNPYLHRALDYPGDPMLSFMHWTHRLYPYGPFWLILTTPISYIGANIFLLTFFLFKILSAGFYLGSVYLVYKINKKINSGWEKFNLVLFALNPLLIIEALVSGHNDVAMVFFSLLGIYLFLVKNKILGIVFVVLSAMIKIPAAVLLLPMVVNLLPIKKYHLNNEKFVWSLMILSTGSVFYSVTKLEIQPWYLLWVIPYASLLRPNKYIISLIIGISLGLLLRYSLFLYSGNWDAVLDRNLLTIFAIVVSLVVGFVWSRKKGYNLT